MSNWDLMMPGMGLTAIGLAGLTISYAGIAHTFIDGMHALTGLTMFVGMIFLAVGILDGGISTSNRAKATTLVILSISLGFGMYAFTMNTSNYTITLAGILMAIAFPAILIAYLSMKHPTLLKPVGSIVGIAGATGIIMWLAFGFVGPDQYMVPQTVDEDAMDGADGGGEQAAAEDVAPAGPVTLPVEIAAGSAIEGEPNYVPNMAMVSQGDMVEWTNADSIAHTVTSASDLGETFDSGLIDAEGVYLLDTGGLEAGEYEYVCIIHPWMVATLTVEAVAQPVTVMIPDGASVPQDGQLYYDPTEVEVPVGTTVVWDNADGMLHTVTSGGPTGGPDGLFDSEMMAAGDVYERVFDEAGDYDYYCILHPWMVGTVTVVE